LNPGVPNADRLFNLLRAAIPTARHVRTHDYIGAVARFAPESDEMRDAIMPLLLARETRSVRRTNADVWAVMTAAESFAEHLSTSPSLMTQVIDCFRAAPRSEGPAAALAEVVLRRREPELEELLREHVGGLPYGFVTIWKLMAAISPPEQITDALCQLLEKDPLETAFWNCSHWVPALLRQLERDAQFADQLIARVASAPSISARISLLALAGKGSKGRMTFRSVISREAEKLENAVVPPFGFDLTSGSNRLARHALQELLV
jgi:hypothetical protein